MKEKNKKRIKIGRRMSKEKLVVIEQEEISKGHHQQF
jgi:hypothetical protein